MRMVEAGYAPDILVGIRSGGFCVARVMAECATVPVELLALNCGWGGMQARKRAAARILPHLPRRVSDMLRAVAHRLLTTWRRTARARPRIAASERAAIRAHLAQTGGRARILVVDDAVDTGLTLATVLELLRAAAPPGTEIRSACITVTLADPVMRPDYALYSQVLCRFPWSLDVIA